VGASPGITDFGDLGFGTRAGDLAIDLCSILRVGGEEPFRTARIAIDGYQSRLPLEGEELDLLGDLVLARLAALVAISAWRVERYPENAEYIQSWDDESWALLEQFDALGFDEVAHELGASRDCGDRGAPAAARAACSVRRSPGSRTESRYTSSVARASGSSTRRGGGTSTATTTSPSSGTATRA
jgi:hypothetical protein